MVDDHADKDRKTKFSTLFKIIYGYGKPNINHFTLAYLIHSGFIEKISQLNFDDHLEEAYENYPEKLETEIVGHVKNSSAKFIKLHGCINEPEKIGTLLYRVASKQNQEKIKPHIEEFLVNGKHKTSLFIGYSFSDVYDIVKLILELNETNSTRKKSFKKIYIFAHEENEEKFDVYTNFNGNQKQTKNIDDYNNLESKPTREITFDSFRIIILRCNSSNFIEKISNYYNLKLKRDENSDLDKIKKEMKIWANSLGLYFNLLIGWRFNYETGQEYVFSKNNNNKEVMLRSLKNALNYCDIILENWDEIEAEGISAGTSKEDIKMRAILTKKHKALTLLSMGKFSEANRLLQSLLSEIENISSDGLNIWLKVDINANLLYVNYFKILKKKYSKISKSIKSCEKYFKQLNKHEAYRYNPIGYHRNLYLIASLKNHLKMSDDDDDKYFLEAITYYERIGRVEYLAFVYMEYAKFLKNSNDEKYEKYIIMAKNLFKNLGYTEYLQFCNFNSSIFND